MRIVTVSRRPCAKGSATASIVQHEAGALNIDATRIGFTDAQDLALTKMKNPTDGGAAAATSVVYGANRPQGKVTETGRWPTNLILQHRPGCRQTGTTTLPGYSINRWTDGAKPFGGGAGHKYETEVFPDETVLLWECTPDCPVYELDGQGELSQLNAARYFKQVQEFEMKDLPEELIDYLVTMIAPPASCEPVLILRPDLENYPWEEHEDSTVHGILTMGNPGPYMEDIDRVLRPGAHLLIVAPEDEPAGYTGACAVEDFGYEIRDAIALLDGTGDFHYVAKANTSERNAGIPSRESEQGRVVQNDHPTIKPIAIMEALLRDIPEGGLIVDPFMGSGTTGIACLRTDHNFIGIDQNVEYVTIADQRIRHWDRAKNAWNGATIKSEAPIEDSSESMSLDDLFGF